ncbi:hypothetical protein L1987_08680 [Smallanthus sonchifolius]|uniref:Uncharacterized protein n=1 Tax=Smallanthus sonchifolius TaxID=185202 RepID=A0ACB9JKU9_9ASTR|nr:hypothetical protein L1987_08680 [Smallanthus sonchifolius]
MVITNLVSMDNIIDMRDKVEEYDKNYLEQESTPLQESSQDPSPPPSPPPTTTTSPPSASSSPTHEFSFTVSFHSHPPPNSTLHHNPNTYDTNNNHKTTNTTLQPPPTPPPQAAIDLSPADDIFFRGHLLPLHPLISHLPDSPRCSTNSMDSFTLPNNLLYYQPNPIGNTSFHCHHQTTFSEFNEPDITTTNQNRPKSKSFSIFGIPKWKKRSDDEIERDDQDQVKDTNSCKKLKLDLGQLIKRYMKMVKPLLSFQKSTRSTTKYNHQSYSFSTNSLTKPPEMNKGGKRRGQFSAPASMRTSPANSGILIASGSVSPTKSTSESTMEELHAAIQAAIAHCKNSIAMEDKVQSQNL